MYTYASVPELLHADFTSIERLGQHLHLHLQEHGLLHCALSLVRWQRVLYGMTGCVLTCSYSKELDKWIEVGNSGMFRPEMLRPMGIPEGVNVIAWGLGLERYKHAHCIMSTAPHGCLMCSSGSRTFHCWQQAWRLQSQACSAEDCSCLLNLLHVYGCFSWNVDRAGPQ